MLKWLFNMLNLPMTVSSVTALRDLPEGASPKVEQLVNVNSSSGPRIGVWVPRVSSPNGVWVFRPDHGSSYLNDRRYLTMGEGDAPLMQRFFGVGAAPTKVEGGSPAGSEVVTTPKKSKLDARMDHLRSTTSALLQHFETDAWCLVKESQFTTPVAKWSSFSAEATNAGEEVLISGASAWMCGLSAGKVFLKAHRDYVKSNHKSQKLLSCYPHMKQFRDFLLDIVQVKLDPRFELLWYKASGIQDVYTTTYGVVGYVWVAEGD